VSRADRTGEATQKSEVVAASIANSNGREHIDGLLGASPRKRPPVHRRQRGSWVPGPDRVGSVCQSAARTSTHSPPRLFPAKASSNHSAAVRVLDLPPGTILDRHDLAGIRITPLLAGVAASLSQTFA